MRNRILCFLSIMIFFIAPAPVHAGFIMKKHATVQTTQNASVSDRTNSVVTTSTAEMTDAMQQYYPKLDRMMGRGWVGIVALVMGILGFIAPIFSIGAVMFGFLGMNKRSRNKGIAIAGFILGVAVICMMAFGGYAPMGIF